MLKFWGFTVLLLLGILVVSVGLLVEAGLRRMRRERSRRGVFCRRVGKRGYRVELILGSRNGGRSE